MNSRDYIYYKIKLHNLSSETMTRVFELAGTVRFLYNRFIDISKEYYNENKKYMTFFKMCKKLTEMRQDPEFAWLQKYHVTPERYALKDLNNAFRRFFSNKRRYPKYKSRKNHRLQFAVRGDGIKFYENGTYVYIPGLSVSSEDLIYCGNHNIPIGKNIKYDDARIISDEHNVWLAVAVVANKAFLFNTTENHKNEPLGIDVGIRNSATLSNGISYDRVNKHRLSVLEHRRRKLQSVIGKDIDRRYKMSQSTRTKYHDIPKSKNIEKLEARLRKTYQQISNIYKTHYHNIAKDIVRQDPEFVVLESLNITNLKTDNKFINHSIVTSRLGILMRYIKEQCNEHSIPIIEAPRFFKSTQICSRCGHTYKPGTSKIYKCPYCGLELDRDLNASINLRNYGMSVAYSL